MKELERTERISISAVLFLLVILIGFLTFEKPQNVFQKDSKSTLNALLKKDYIVHYKDLKDLDPATYVLIDVRDAFEFNKGHIDGAINITAFQAFDDATKEMFRKTKSEGKTIILYSEDPDKASSAWMLLHQLGYENVKILDITTSFKDNKFIVKEVEIEKPAVNYAEVMKKATSSSGVTEKPKAPKKVITVKKKKKRVAEGGC